MHKITKRYLSLAVCIICSLLFLEHHAEAYDSRFNSASRFPGSKSPPSMPDIFARSGPLMENNAPIVVNGKPLPASTANLPPQGQWTLGKNQCALYVNDDIMAFNGALVGKGLNTEQLKQVHLSLGSSIYPPELREGNGWAIKGSIAVSECRKIALNVQRVLRAYLKNGEHPEGSGIVESEEQEEEKKEEEERSELQKLRGAICRAFNPTIKATAVEEEKEEEEEEAVQKTTSTTRAPVRQRLVKSPSVLPFATPPAVASALPVRTRVPVTRASSRIPVSSKEPVAERAAAPVRQRMSASTRSTAAVPSGTQALQRQRSESDPKAIGEKLAEAKKAGRIPENDEEEEGEEGGGEVD
jgi:hypothetical protein